MQLLPSPVLWGAHPRGHADADPCDWFVPGPSSWPCGCHGACWPLGEACCSCASRWWDCTELQPASGSFWLCLLSTAQSWGSSCRIPESLCIAQTCFNLDGKAFGSQPAVYCCCFLTGADSYFLLPFLPVTHHQSLGCLGNTGFGEDERLWFATQRLELPLLNPIQSVIQTRKWAEIFRPFRSVGS